MKNRIFLYGPPGAGKTTLGRGLSERLGLPFVDLDQMIVERAGGSIPDIFAAEGEQGFRVRERDALRQAAHAAPAIVALGGETLLNAANRELAEKHGVILLLDADSDTLAARAANAPGTRPPIDCGTRQDGAPRENLESLLARRATHYASFQTRLRVADAPPDIHLDRAQILLGRYRIAGMGKPYNLYAGAGALSDLGVLLAANGCRGRVLLVGDSNTEPLFGGPVTDSLQNAGFAVSRLAIPAGEAHKQIGTVAKIWRACLRAGIDRGDTLVACGGGIVGDLAGFAAATWLRGVRWVGVPTTLLAMVDSSLGGKTGADLPEGKNLIGAFHPPTLVLADTNTLATLPDEEFRAGLAEVVKHGIIADPELYDQCRQGFDSLRQAPPTSWVNRAMAVKIHIIEKDPYETGIRAALNLGHTIGHGIEQALSFRLRHGEAVAIGLTLEARLAERLGVARTGLADDMAGVLSALGLPTSPPPDLDRSACLAAIRLDKKRQAGIARFALPVCVGEVRTGVPVDDASLAAVLC